jgi:hypothetical protein
MSVSYVIQCARDVVLPIDAFPCCIYVRYSYTVTLHQLRMYNMHKSTTRYEKLENNVQICVCTVHGDHFAYRIRLVDPVKYYVLVVCVLFLVCFIFYVPTYRITTILNFDSKHCIISIVFCEYSETS